jgi:hypothetical protein
MTDFDLSREDIVGQGMHWNGRVGQSAQLLVCLIQTLMIWTGLFIAILIANNSGNLIYALPGLSNV